MSIKVKRVYEPAAKSDGERVLVDRLWPRGLKKEEAHIDLWLKELAPESALRKWFGHEPAKWPEFKKRYYQELETHNEDLRLLREKAHHRTISLIYAARDSAHNNAVALKEYLETHAG